MIKIILYYILWLPIFLTIFFIFFYNKFFFLLNKFIKIQYFNFDYYTKILFQDIILNIKMIKVFIASKSLFKVLHYIILSIKLNITCEINIIIDF